jgi:cellulose biosynthesis protein BcsQ
MTSEKSPAMIYTFYSYKGGVGRSMALANVGALMAKWGSRVLIVDWDLEAPGLEMFFQRYMKNFGSRERTSGIVDMLHARAAGYQLDWHDCLLTTDLENLHIISAGKVNEHYQTRAHQLNWVQLFEKHDIGNYIDHLRNAWQEEYDFVLLDSRTGITDIGDICTVLLPDVLVLLFISNYQNIQGIKKTVARARLAHQKIPRDRSRLLAVPIPARDEVYTEYEQSQRWKETFAHELGDLYLDWLPRSVTPSNAMNKLFIPYVTNWSFGERLPVLEVPSEIENPVSISAAYGRLATLLKNRLDWQSIDMGAPYYELQAERSSRLEAESQAHQAAAETSKTRYTYRWIGTIGSLISILSVILAIYSWNRSNRPIPPKSLATRAELQEAVRLPSPDWSLIKQTLETWASNGTSLAGLDLSSASLRGIDLRGADLARANLAKADLTDANLSGTNLESANLSGAVLTKTVFSNAVLTNADLRGANAKLSVGLTRAQMREAIGIDPNLLKTPSEGSNPDSRR